VLEYHFNPRELGVVADLVEVGKMELRKTILIIAGGFDGMARFLAVVLGCF